MRSGLRRLRARTAGDLRPDEDGFTLIEMMIAMTILAVTLLALAYGLFGGMRVLQAARQRSTFLELANAEVEAMRALEYEDVGVSPGDPALTANPAHYELVGGELRFDGRDAVTTTTDGTTLATSSPPIVTEEDGAPVEGLLGGYKVERWVTWTNPQGTDTPRRFKRLDVRITWDRRGGSPGSVSYSSVYYPGNLGEPPPAPAPTASFTVSPAMGVTGHSFGFDGSGSTDPDGLSLTYSWDFGDLTSGTGQTLTHQYSAIGTYTITLQVTNTDGEVSTPATRQVLVGAPAILDSDHPDYPNGPIAAFSVAPDTGPAPLTVFADANASTDPDGDPLLYTWNWNDGTPNDTGVSPSHVYTTTGTKTITLTVTDPSGQTSTASATVVVAGVVCEVTSAEFNNPPPLGSYWDPADPNQTIKVNGGSRKPLNVNFAFRARTTTACESVLIRIPRDGGTYETNLTAFTTAGSVRTFTGTSSVGNAIKFNIGNNQTADARGSDGTVTFNLSYPFSVVT